MMIWRDSQSIFKIIILKKKEFVTSFFTPKLSNEELKLVEKADEDHLKTYSEHYVGRNPDVDIDEMKRSDSKSKYVHVRCLRFTIPLTLEQSETKTADESFNIKNKSFACCHIL